MYHVTKHYPHSLGLSACFRQWRADSHCSNLHGYALAFTYEFEAQELDKNNWVIDFGSMKPIKQWLESTFDHRLIVAKDDPSLDVLGRLDMDDIAAPKVMERVGCEAFANAAFKFAKNWLIDSGQSHRVRLTKVTCSEHEGNSAAYSES